MLPLAQRRLILDVDDTLYSAASGIHNAIKRQIKATPPHFLQGFKQLETDAQGNFTNFPDLLLDLQRRDPALLRAYVRHAYAVDKVPYDKLAPDPALRRALQRHPGGFGLYTNGVYEHHVRLVLHKLALADLVPQHHTVDALAAGSGRTKPSLAGYRHASNILGARPEDTLFADDSAPNLAVAKQLGAATIWVNETGRAYPENHVKPDFVITHPRELPQLLADLRGGQNRRPVAPRRAVSGATLKT